MATIGQINKLRSNFDRLGREGISERAHDLVTQYMEKYPNGNWKEACKLVGRMHALYLAIPTHEYWREMADRGFMDEFYELPIVGKAEGTER